MDFSLIFTCDNDEWEVPQSTRVSLTDLLYDHYGDYPKFDTIIINNNDEICYSIALDYPLVNKIILRTKSKPFYVFKKCDAQILFEGDIIQIQVENFYDLINIHNINNCRSIFIVNKQVW